MSNTYSKLSKIFNYNQKKDWDHITYSHIKNSTAILDAGCGIGRFLEMDPVKITGLERNTANIKLAKEKGYSVTNGNVTNIPFGKNTFDAVHCSHVIEHLTPDELHQALQEFDRILKPNGKLIIIAPLLWIHFYSDLTHVKPYNPDAILHYLDGGIQRTKKVISTQYTLTNIYWRHTPLTMRSLSNYNKNIFHRLLLPLIRIIDWVIYTTKLGFLFQKNGYMIILQKCKK